MSEYLNKGDLALVEGRLQWRSWETEDGQKRSKHDVVASTVQFLPRQSRDDMGAARPSSFATSPAARASNDQGNGPMVMEDDIPF